MINVPLRLASLNVCRREHWAARTKRVKHERNVVGWALVAVLGRRTRPPAAPTIVTITRVGPRAFDKDNLIGSAKAVRDEVAAWLLVDDDDPIVEWRVEQAKGAYYAVRVEIQPTEGAK